VDPFRKIDGYQQGHRWRLGGLDPLPEEEWQRMLTFLNLSQDERSAMLATVEILFRRGYELVVGTYDMLLQNPDTAAILGWERRARCPRRQDARIRHTSQNLDSFCAGACSALSLCERGDLSESC